MHILFKIKSIFIYSLIFVKKKNSCQHFMLLDAFAGLDNFIELSITDIIYLVILVY